MQHKAHSYVENLLCLAASITVSSGCCIAMIQGLYLMAKSLCDSNGTFN